MTIPINPPSQNNNSNQTSNFGYPNPYTQPNNNFYTQTNSSNPPPSFNSQNFSFNQVSTS